MRPTTLLQSLFTLGALSSPLAIATPGEIMPDQSGIVDGEATWYCTWSYEIMYERFVLEGHKWAVSEKELKDLIPGTITGWEFTKLGTVEDGKTWSDFRAKWNLPIGYHGKVSKSLNKFVRDDNDFECHLVDLGPDR